MALVKIQGAEYRSGLPCSFYFFLYQEPRCFLRSVLNLTYKQMWLLVPVFFSYVFSPKLNILSVKTLEIAIDVLITSCLDYCKYLYLGISKSSIACLQLVQNTAAKT